MKSLFQRAVVTALCPLMVLSGLPSPAWAAREVACESHGMQRNFCSTGAHGEIRLVSNSGLWPCKQGETWGIESEGIWVDQNCKGRFSVDDAKSDNKGAIVAGVIGLGILAAIAANHAKKDDDRGPDDRPPPPPGPGPGRPPPGNDWGRPDYPPDWMVGQYQGYNGFYKAEMSMQVSPGGRISTRSGSFGQWGRYVGDRTIRFEDGKRFEVDRTRGGLRLIEYGNRRNVTDLQRVR